ncbi:hypothetical protein GRI40_02585 [Altererythrobacter aerius]|uniref:Uncharacterized protein n=1 Tax=Tsuneonella aeria TaxID=1837929 RepID=A0A6I4TBS0_9SPHN|nr:hypothetical protein [Tsuneonella aeria]MXO74107.1 hypothetical protein [Tsuneonella aeria]
MDQNAINSSGDFAAERILFDALAHGDAVLGTIGPVLGHLLANHDHSLFSDEILTRVRGMVNDIARQLLLAQGEAAEVDDPRAFAATFAGALADTLLAERALTAHCHALAIEWHATARLEAQNAIDPVLSPLLQALVSSDDAPTAAAAMAALAAQARFVQQQRRMELPLSELPADLLHLCIASWRSHVGEQEEGVSGALARVRESYDEGASRLARLARLVHGMGPGMLAALSVAHAGVAIFLTALSAASHQDRALTVLATNDRQIARFALSMRAAGLKPRAIEEQFLYFHPEGALPPELDSLGADRARALLSASSRSSAG